VQVDRKRPGCFVFLLDQSESMKEPMSGGDGRKKSQALATIINDTLETIVLRCRKALGEPPRHFFDIGLIGYSTAARPLFTERLAGRVLASVAEIATAKLRVEPDDSGRLHPVWFDPIADGVTNLHDALDLAEKVVEGWAASHPSSDPPIVINISDGAPTGENPESAARRLTAISTSVGQTLLFNVAISSKQATPIFFPSTDDGLDQYAQLLFRMSSPLPELMQQFAIERRLGAPAGARGFVFNADVQALIQAIEVGTRVEYR